MGISYKPEKILVPELIVPAESNQLIVEPTPVEGKIEDIFKELSERNLKMPTSKETVAILYEIIKNKTDPLLRELNEDFIQGRNGGFFEGTGQFELAKEHRGIRPGYFFVDSPTLEQVKGNWDLDEIIDKYKKNEPGIFYVPNQENKDKQNTTYTIARYGLEGALKFTELFNHIRNDIPLSETNASKDKANLVEKIKAINDYGFICDVGKIVCGINLPSLNTGDCNFKTLYADSEAYKKNGFVLGIKERK